MGVVPRLQPRDHVHLVGRRGKQLAFGDVVERSPWARDRNDAALRLQARMHVIRADEHRPDREQRRQTDQQVRGHLRKRDPLAADLDFEADGGDLGRHHGRDQVDRRNAAVKR